MTRLRPTPNASIQAPSPRARRAPSAWAAALCCLMAGAGCAATAPSDAPGPTPGPIAAPTAEAPPGAGATPPPEAAGASAGAGGPAAMASAVPTAASADGMAATAPTATATANTADGTPTPTPRAAPAADTPYGPRDDVLRAAEVFAGRHGLDRAWVASRLAEARYLPRVAQLIMPPAVGTPKNWRAYRARFIDATRIRAGVQFWNQHQATLLKAQAIYGVPAEIVVGIIGVETLYGRHMGGFRAIDALATLAFDFPPGRRDRSAFFQDELGQLLLLAHREGIEPSSLRGSYAGAIGLPQFMPSSWNRHAIDFDGDGHIDLRGSPADAIGSVAHYLSAYGWAPGMPTEFAVRPPTDAAQLAVLLEPDIVPSFTADEMSSRGAQLEAAGRRFEGKLALVRLENGEAAPSHVAGTPNFYVITRYNWSSYYAMAVIDLGREVARAATARAAAR